MIPPASKERGREVTAFVQARMSSHRLPGKVLLPFFGKPLLGQVIERLKRSKRLSGIVVLTSLDSSDDKLAEWCLASNVPCERGSLHDVAGRFVQAIGARGVAAFLRVCADRPFCDVRLIDQAIEKFQESPVDIVTNMVPPTFPKGQTVEVVDAGRFIKAYADMSSPDDFEHVTHYFYRRSGEFSIYRLRASNDGNYHDVHMCIDSRTDYERCLMVAEALGPRYVEATWEEVLREFQRLPDVGGGE